MPPPLTSAITHDDVSAVRAALDEGLDPNGAIEIGLARNGRPNLWPLVMLASFSGAKDVLRLLVERGARIDALNTDGYTSLMWVCRNAGSQKDAQIVEALLALGADSSAESPSAQTALDHLAKSIRDSVKTNGTLPKEEAIALHAMARTLHRSGAQSSRAATIQTLSRLPSSNSTRER